MNEWEGEEIKRDGVTLPQQSPTQTLDHECVTRTNAILLFTRFEWGLGVAGMHACMHAVVHEMGTE